MIIDYDSNNYAVLIEKKKLENVGFREGDDYYVVNLDRGVIALVKKSDFKNVLKQKIRDSLGSDYNTMRDYGLTNEQIKVIDKIIGVKFEERTKSNISTNLTDEENHILEDLIKSKTIKLYDQGKYTDKPVYSVTPDLFRYVKTSLSANQGKIKINSSPNPPQPKISSNVNTSKINSLVEDVNKKGFILAKSDNEAKMISESLSQKIKSGQILGIKGFDSYYYIFNSNFFNKSNEKIVKCFSENEGKCSLKNLSEKTGLDENVCKGILMFLLDKGDIIEKPNSIYQMI